MSSNEEENNDFEPDFEALAQGPKKRRVQRACDMCRRKKSRCDGAQMPGDTCSVCVALGRACTYMETAKKRGPPKGYIEALKNRVAMLQVLLPKLCPGNDMMKVTSPRDTVDSPSSLVGTHTDITTSTPRGGEELIPKAEPEDDTIHLSIVDNMKRLSLENIERRFFGQSSGAMLLQTATELKSEFGNKLSEADPVTAPQRAKSEDPRQWEESIFHTTPDYRFPPEDLAKSLIDLYFQQINLILPLLHRPTFERQMAEGLHGRDTLFGAVVLLVCAVGSRFSDDPRVISDGEGSFMSCGWKWFEQVQIVRQKLLVSPSLFELQMHCLAVQYLQGTSAPQACWTLVGVGIRYAQDVGLHRRNLKTTPWTVEDELQKRAFWVLVAMDIQMGCELGRPCALQDEDYDADYPLEVDDEYWEHPDSEVRFEQPPGMPSLVTAFNVFLKLKKLLAFTLRTVYSINKSKIQSRVGGQQWEHHIVSELNSALNKWVDAVPDHLRWDPNRQNIQFFQQSVVLYANYYHLQIILRRPFIFSSRKPSAVSFHSLAICTNAARSCSHVVDVMSKRHVNTAPFCLMPAFASGIMLLLNIWGGKRSGLASDPQKEMVDVHKCMSVLASCEERWNQAGRLWDLLHELTCVGELPLPQPSPPNLNKRERDEGEYAENYTTTSQPSPQATEQGGPLRPVVGSRRVHHAMQQAVPSPPPQWQPHHQRRHELPVYTEELGRMPLHGQVDITTHVPASSIPSHYYMENHQVAGQPDYSQVLQHQPPQNPSADQVLINPVWDGSGNTSGYSYPMAHMTTAVVNEPQPQVFPSQVLADQSVVSSSSSEMYPYWQTQAAAAAAAAQWPQAQVQVQQQQQPFMINDDLVTMWMNAPTGFGSEDWGAYLDNANELTHGVNIASR